MAKVAATLPNQSNRKSRNPSDENMPLRVPSVMA
jgi:hypothetical protein